MRTVAVQTVPDSVKHGVQALARLLKAVKVDLVDNLRMFSC
jgi:hypothetical protein